MSAQSRFQLLEFFFIYSINFIKYLLYCFYLWDVMLLGMKSVSFSGAKHHHLPKRYHDSYHEHVLNAILQRDDRGITRSTRSLQLESYDSIIKSFIFHVATIILNSWANSSIQELLYHCDDFRVLWQNLVSIWCDLVKHLAQ